MRARTPRTKRIEVRLKVLENSQPLLFRAVEESQSPAKEIIELAELGVYARKFGLGLHKTGKKTALFRWNEGRTIQLIDEIDDAADLTNQTDLPGDFRSS